MSKQIQREKILCPRCLYLFICLIFLFFLIQLYVI